MKDNSSEPSLWYVGVDGQLHFTPLTVITGFMAMNVPEPPIIHATLTFIK